MNHHVGAPKSFPDWLPDPVRLYLVHTETGLSLREIARREGRHASTILRQVRRSEMRRDDPLWDEALAALSRSHPRRRAAPAAKDDPAMTAPLRPTAGLLDETSVEREARRILRRLVEPGAVLAVAPDLDKAVVLRSLPDGHSARTAVVDRPFAQAFALKDWIACRKPGRIATYEITTAGRAALKRMLDADERAMGGMAEAGAVFADQHRVWAARDVDEEGGTKRLRYNLAESPIAVLSRKKDKDGKTFLDSGLVDAAERLREDFELAQMGPRVAQNWERFLTGGDRGSFRSDSGLAEGPRAARERVASALRDLGPGLGDVVLRCCCFLDGLETTERRMGWAARSGKIVLRIALMRLKRHYDEAYGKSGPLIG